MDIFSLSHLELLFSNFSELHVNLNLCEIYVTLTWYIQGLLYQMSPGPHGAIFSLITEHELSSFSTDTLFSLQNIVDRLYYCEICSFFLCLSWLILLPFVSLRLFALRNSTLEIHYSYIHFTLCLKSFESINRIFKIFLTFEQNQSVISQSYFS